MSAQLCDDQDAEVSHQFMGNNATQYKKRLFIEGLRNEGTLHLAAKHAGINRTTAWRWRELDMGFSNAWDDALEDAVDVQETSVYRRGLNGSTIDSIFYLKAKRPQFRDRMSIDLDALRNEVKAKVESVLQERQVNSIDVTGETGQANSTSTPSVKTLLQSALARSTTRDPTT
jgi:hypothetical protein